MNFSLRLELNQGPAVICYLYRPTLYQLSYKEFSKLFYYYNYFYFYFIIIKKNNFLNELYFYKIKKLFLSLFFYFFIFYFFIFLFFFLFFIFYFLVINYIKPRNNWGWNVFCRVEKLA